MTLPESATGATASTSYIMTVQPCTTTSSWPNPNNLLAAVRDDLATDVHLTGVQTLGILDKLMTGPLWRILEDPAHVILDVSSHLLQLKLNLERFSVDASPLMEGVLFC
jgi:hypothetical protein